MDQDLSPSSTPRKVKFAPKGPPPPRAAKTSESRAEAAEDGVANTDTEAAQDLLRRVKEHWTRRKPKAEKQSSVQVAFAHGVASSTSLKTYGIPREVITDRSKSRELGDSASDDPEHLSSPSAGRTPAIDENSITAADVSLVQKKRECREPWDYHHSYYPITLPFRRPYSGDPELLDEAEFGKDAASLEYDENTINSAAKLGLLGIDDKPQLLFLQLPVNLPLSKRPATVAMMDKASPLLGTGVTADMAQVKERVGDVSSIEPSSKGKEVAGNSYSGKANSSNKGCSLEELPAGYMGKMLVYKSGAVKLKLGDILYDVSPGSDCNCPQDVVAINTTDKHCCALGKLEKRAVVTPDIDSLLDSSSHLN